MKLLGSFITILVLIVCAGLWTNHELQVSTDALVKQIDLISVQISENQWPAALKQTEKLEEVWEKEAKWWPVFLEHQEMDNIEFSMARFKEYVISKNNSLSLGQLAEIRIMVEHIPRKEEISLKNIL